MSGEAQSWNLAPVGWEIVMDDWMFIVTSKHSESCCVVNSWACEGIVEMVDDVG